jgi:hypothetical protein
VARASDGDLTIWGPYPTDEAAENDIPLARREYDRAGYAPEDVDVSLRLLYPRIGEQNA